MKLAVVNDVVYAYASGNPAANGGAERYQWLLARALAGAGWSVTVGVREVLAAGERTAIDGVEFVGIGRDHVLLAWYRFLLSERPDWWHWQCASHWWGPAVEIAKLAGVHTIFNAMHDRDIQPRNALFRRSRLWPLYAWGLMRTDRILVQHEEQLTELAPRWRAKAAIMPGIVNQAMAVRPHSERAKYVAWVAELRQPKRPDLLIEIARKASTIRFVVCGGPRTFSSAPGYGEQIMAEFHATPNIEFLGHVAPERALQIIADAAILLSTSDEEGFPSVFLEAWASGTPVVSLKVDPDHVIERIGLGSVSGDVRSAIADIQALLDSPQQRDEIAVRARLHAAEAHGEAAAVRALERALHGGWH